MILISNYLSLLQSRFKPGFGSACVLQFKKCIKSDQFDECAASLYNCGDVGSSDYRVFRMPKVMEEVSVMLSIPESFSANDNQANRNMCIFNAKNDDKLCQILCQTDSFDNQMKSECLGICRIASELSIFNDCPFEKNCERGCPCPKYECKKNFYPAQTSMIITTAIKNKPQNHVIDYKKAEVVRHLMFMSFNKKVGKIVGKKIASFSFNDEEIFKTILMEGQHYVFRYSNGASHVFIQRFNEKEIILEMQVPVSEPFNVYGGFFVAGSGQYGPYCMVLLVKTRFLHALQNLIAMPAFILLMEILKELSQNHLLIIISDKSF